MISDNMRPERTARAHRLNESGRFTSSGQGQRHGGQQLPASPQNFEDFIGRIGRRRYSELIGNVRYSSGKNGPMAHSGRISYLGEDAIFVLANISTVFRYSSFPVWALVIHDGQKIWHARTYEERCYLFVISIWATRFCWNNEGYGKLCAASEDAVTLSATCFYHWNIDLHLGDGRLSPTKQKEPKGLWKWWVNFSAYCDVDFPYFYKT